MNNTIVHRPAWFRVPQRGGDPYFGFSKAWYYSAEKRGVIKLKRVCERGKVRGATLINYDMMDAFVMSQGEAPEQTEAQSQTAAAS